MVQVVASCTPGGHSPENERLQPLADIVGRGAPYDADLSCQKAHPGLLACQDEQKSGWQLVRTERQIDEKIRRIE